MKFQRKFLIFGLIILALVGFFYFRSQSSNQTKLQFASVKKQDIKSTVSSSGTLTGKDSINLKFKSSGKLAYLNVKVGDSVSAYQTIAGLDVLDLNIKLQQAQNTLRDKQAAAEKALDDVKDHSKDETFSQRKDRTAAEVARDNAYDSVREAQRAFGDATLVAPISGLITQSDPIVGQTISSSDLIAQIVDTQETFFDTDIDEADIGKISLEKKAEVTLDAYGDKIFTGSVEQIKPQTKTTSSGATVVTVKIKLKETPANFVNGLSGQATIILEESKDTLTIPQEALREEKSPVDSSSYTVFVQSGQSTRQKKVKIGIKSDTDVEVKEGLEENDRVLLNPPSQGTGLNQNRNPIQGIIFRVFGGPRGTGGFNGRR